MSPTVNMIKDLMGKVNLHLERGRDYDEAGDKVQALNNYIEALDCLALSIYMMDAETGQETLNNKINSTFKVSSCLIKIMDCLSDKEYDKLKKAYISNKLTIIYEALNNHKETFDLNSIVRLEAISSSIMSTKHLVSEYQDFLDSREKIKPENEADKILGKIRDNLLTISKTKYCLTPLEKFSGCFIATAAYSTSIHPDLDTFRSFRDEKLLPHAIGKKLVSIYYKLSPSLARAIDRQPAIKKLLKHHLSRLANWMRS